MDENTTADIPAILPVDADVVEIGIDVWERGIITRVTIAVNIDITDALKYGAMAGIQDALRKGLSAEAIKIVRILSHESV